MNQSKGKIILYKIPNTKYGSEWNPTVGKYVRPSETIEKYLGYIKEWGWEVIGIQDDEETPEQNELLEKGQNLVFL
jgi:hypothetical protein